MDPPYGGSVVRTATTASNKPRQRGHAIATLSLATTYFYFIYLPDAIVTSFVVPYRPPRNSVPILLSILVIDVNTPISTRFLSGTRDLLCVYVYVFIKLHKITQPGPAKLTFLCYHNNGSTLWGILSCT